LEKDFTNKFKENLFKINSLNYFKEQAILLFHYQAENNIVYKNYIKYLNINIDKIINLEDIPFLPIEFFKYHKVISNIKEEDIELVFESSGTTGEITSKHLVKDLNFYKKVSENIFYNFYGKLDEYIFLALLPSYLERENSSLVYMVDHFIKESKSTHSGFYLNDLEKLKEKLISLKNQHKKIVLIGVTFALLDFAEQFSIDLEDIIIIETGGMKGRRKEMIREEVHQILQEKLNVKNIHSEYGMTELLSQAYSKGDGLFVTPNSMKVLIRDINDPFSYNNKNKSGGLNIIDLANVDSCSFIETKDIGYIEDSNQFKILGRLDNSDIRGCNLLINNF